MFKGKISTDVVTDNTTSTRAKRPRSTKKLKKADRAAKTRAAGGFELPAVTRSEVIAMKERLASAKLVDERITITPRMAAVMLDAAINYNNRKLAWSHAAKIAADMREGLWIETNASIGIEKSGVVLDGQHRLAAIAMFGKPHKMLVSRGLEFAARGVIDANKPRAVSDLLIWRNEGVFNAMNAPKAASVGSAIFGNGSPVAKRSKIAQALFVEDHQKAILWACNTHTSKTTGVVRASVFAVLARAFYNEDRERLQRFCELLDCGASQSVSERGVIVLRDWLMTSNLAGHMSTQISYRLVEFVLRAFLDGKAGSIKVRNDLQETTVELFPLKDEQPKKFHPFSAIDRQRLERRADRIVRARRRR